MAVIPRAAATLTVSFTDPEGERSTTDIHFDLPGSAPISAFPAFVDLVLADVITLTQAAIDHATLSFYFGNNYVLPGESGQLDDIEDKVLVEFVTGSGLKQVYNFPAPVAGVFGTDGETADPTVAPLNAVQTAFTTPGNYAIGTGTASVVTLNDVQLTTYIKGYRRRAKTRRRLRQGIWTEMGG